MKLRTWVTVLAVLLFLIGLLFFVDDIFLHMFEETGASPFLGYGFPYEHWLYGLVLMGIAAIPLFHLYRKNFKISIKL